LFPLYVRMLSASCFTDSLEILRPSTWVTSSISFCCTEVLVWVWLIITSPIFLEYFATKSCA
jgi:hypothetical protein